MKRKKIAEESIPTKIEQNFAYLKNSREPVEKRVIELRELLADSKELIKKATTDEERALFRESIESCQSSLQLVAGFQAELEQEIKRVDDAVQTLKSDDIEELRQAYESFVLTDTSFSVKNIGMMLYDFDNLIKSIREFNNGPFLSDLDAQ